ncbi:hypothetical protein BG011_000450 [Mortierella polycephala]|uniref:BZIP domain-containing protein n=1 Tax=Mortierella polycephala TaxID=41804 RepID=A0A9P6PL70_9FUNG|nr:hypothetical protein BG011_000450 [Mortierella polycephala]
MRQPLPELRIIQQEFTRRDKRPYPGSASSARKPQTSEDEDDTNMSRRFSQDSDISQTESSQPPVKIRKKPGRKPNPASPAVRKEQNRAAQRAFRDRKERYLQQMESTIKELRENNAQITQKSQQEAQQLKGSIQSLQSENYYLREVVFSFETALSKGGNVAILQEVKEELYRRHYEKHSRKRIAGAGSQEHGPPTPTTPSMFLPNGSPPLPGLDISQSNQDRIFDQRVTPPKTSPSSSSSSSTSPVTPAVNATSPQSSSAPSVESMTPQDNTVLSMNADILYKAPPSIPFIIMESGRPSKPGSSTRPASSPRKSSSPAGTETYPIRRSEYTKHAMFDELQSALFPPGTLQSIIRSSLSTPQEIVNDIPLLDQLHEHRPFKDPVAPPAQNAFTFSTCSIDVPSFSSFLDDDNSDLRLATSTLGLDDGLKQNVIPSKRLQLEIRVLASAPPAVDPNIDAKIYSLPHDSRIDLIPCPRLRAQMILHQKNFDIEDLCQLLINGAICHGHPLDPHSWELPEAFFDRYGFLLGEEMLRHRNKIWPKKDELFAGKYSLLALDAPILNNRLLTRRSFFD